MMTGSTLGAGRTGEAQASFTEIAFIDPGIPFLDDLVRDLRDDVCAIVLDADRHAPAQIADALGGREGLLAIHIIAHGEAGAIAFSAGPLSLSTLEAAAPALALMGASLSRDGGLLLWSCETGSGRRGADFVAGLTHAIGPRRRAGCPRAAR
jgi:hypothetical protein